MQVITYRLHCACGLSLPKVKFKHPNKTVYDVRNHLKGAPG